MRWNGEGDKRFLGKEMWHYGNLRLDIVVLDEDGSDEDVGKLKWGRFVRPSKLRHASSVGLARAKQHGVWGGIPRK